MQLSRQDVKCVLTLELICIVCIVLFFGFPMMYMYRCIDV